MSSDIEVSIIIPTRNRWPLLQSALATALDQGTVATEVIVVDDGSNDDTGRRLAAIADPRIRVLSHPERQGPAAARNTGIAAARGRWIAFLDDDDLWSPNKLRAQLDAAGAVGATFAYCHAVLFDQAHRTVTLDVMPPSPEALPAALINRNAMPAGSSNVIVRADLLARTGTFDARLSQLADWDMWLRLAEAGRPAVSSEVAVACRRHATNMLLTDRDDVHQEFSYLAAKHRAITLAHGTAFDPVAFSHWVASGQLRAGRRVAAARTHLRAALAHRDLGHLGCALRAPLGERAMGLRQPAPPVVAPPDWLVPHLG